MKTKILVLAVLLSTSGVASAAVNWQGEAMVIALAGTCPDTTAIGDNFLALYRPRNLSDNGTSSYLTFMARRNAYSIKFTNTGAGSAYTAVDLSSRGSHAARNGTLGSFATSPATVIATTKTLVINTKINDWFGDAGCTATIQGAFVLRRDPPL